MAIDVALGEAFDVALTAGIQVLQGRAKYADYLDIISTDVTLYFVTADIADGATPTGPQIAEQIDPADCPIGIPVRGYGQLAVACATTGNARIRLRAGTAIDTDPPAEPGGGGAARPTTEIIKSFPGSWTDPSADMLDGAPTINATTGLITVTSLAATEERGGFADGLAWVMWEDIETGDDFDFDVDDFDFDNGDTFVFTVFDPVFPPSGEQWGLCFALVNDTDPTLASGYGIVFSRQGSLARRAFQTNGNMTTNQASVSGTPTQFRMEVRRIKDGTASMLTILFLQSDDDGVTWTRLNDQIASNFGAGPVHLMMSLGWLAAGGAGGSASCRIGFHVKKGSDEDLSTVT